MDDHPKRWLSFGLFMIILIAMTCFALFVIAPNYPFDTGDRAFLSEVQSATGAWGTENSAGAILGQGKFSAPFARGYAAIIGGISKSNPVTTLRWAALLCGLVTCFALMAIARRIGGLWTGLTAGLFLLGNPNYMRGLYAPQAEVVIGAVFFLFATCLVLTENNRRWLPPLALCACVACGIDHQGPWLLIGALVALAFRPTEKEPTTRGEVSIAIVSMGTLSALTIGVLLFLAVWPWVHDESLQRILEYMTGPFAEAHSPMLHRGINWNATTSGTPPWYIAPDLFVSRLPLLQSLALIAGLVWAIRDSFRARRDESESTLLPFLTIFGTGMIICSLNGSPYYRAGTHYLGVYAPFIALLASIGMKSLWESLSNAWSFIPRNLAAACLATFLFVTPGILSSARSLPANGEFVGALEVGRFAVESGWTSSFPGPILHEEMITWIATNATDQTLAFIPDPDGYRRRIEALKKSGSLPQNIRVASHFVSDLIVVPRLPQYPAWRVFQQALQGTSSIAEISIEGEVLYLVYAPTRENP